FALGESPDHADDEFPRGVPFPAVQAQVRPDVPLSVGEKKVPEQHHQLTVLTGLPVNEEAVLPGEFAGGVQDNQFENGIADRPFQVPQRSVGLGEQDPGGGDSPGKPGRWKDPKGFVGRYPQCPQGLRPDALGRVGYIFQRQYPALFSQGHPKLGHAAKRQPAFQKVVNPLYAGGKFVLLEMGAAPDQIQLCIAGGYLADNGSGFVISGIHAQPALRFCEKLLTTSE
ncbi:MAG: hypothetical protein HOE30_08045, partial [Deltaproteobacteria bacterium]|nr:hypothetical protein [Deltaproteobacteria bacterium]